MKTRCSFVAFLFVLLLPGLSGAADVALFGMIKSQQFVQTNSSAPVSLASNGFAFNAFVFASGSHLVTNATVKPGNSTPLRALLPDSTEEVWRFEERFNTQAALDAVYPNGNIFLPVNYTMTMRTLNDGTKTANLDFTTAVLLGTPPTPQVTNFPATQVIDTTASFTLRWSAAGNSFDLVQVLVLDSASNSIYASPVPLSEGALTGQSNAVVIPPNTLPPGANLTGHISFARPGLPNTNSYPGAVGVPAIVKDTEFPIVTRPAPAPPLLEVLSMDAAPFQLRYTGEADRNYHLQATIDFLSWQDLLVTNAPTATYADPQSGTLDQRFYRIQVGP